MHKRLFLGIPLSDRIKTSLHVSLEPLKELYPQWKWVKKENYHITISFFGSIEEKQIPLLSAVVSETIRTIPSFSLTITELLLAPPLQKPRMLWAVAANSHDFLQLVQKIESAIAQTIELPDYRKSASPIPHVTLARFKLREVEIKSSFPLLDLKEAVKSLILFESQLSNRGSNYTDIVTYSLAELDKS